MTWWLNILFCYQAGNFLIKFYLYSTICDNHMLSLHKISFFNKDEINWQKHLIKEKQDHWGVKEEYHIVIHPQLHHIDIQIANNLRNWGRFAYRKISKHKFKILKLYIYFIKEKNNASYYNSHRIEENQVTTCFSFLYRAKTRKQYQCLKITLNYKVVYNKCWTILADYTL